MRSDYTQVFRARQAVDKYERVTYAPGSYDTAVDARQRAYLRRRIRRWFPAELPVQHDFACGTGRAIRMLDGLVHQAHGYDTSPAMLDQARDYGVKAVLHQVSENGPVPQAAAAPRPSLVTIFRFLLNVPEPTRDRALDFAAQVLDRPESGLLVVENHGPRHSLRGLSRRRNVGDAWFAELSHAQVTALLNRHGFHIVERAGFALCPAGVYRRPALRRAARVVDGITAKLPLSAVATDVLYVAERRP